MVRKFKTMHHNTPQGGPVAGGMADAQAASVFLEGVVQYPVQAVLDVPVAAHQVGHLCVVEVQLVLKHFA